ncbi:transcriptional regulator, TrmB [Beutenbergia cavernae DSM 12333]|uniref:Transcriptional regulator, TrmB n=1 Tax=Beutenbergia cavernae (strain ATCC BAA-8 / DSM 12333 / CCUG 43141 / JCM 11478 / NBRC 16432 / NCIMB 13614 / HKI 0122) TaxID=471853 RepID=C5BUX3_BEUC1|nr:helix-turn-helix domain-containing protein [Beutenbergia cavernae]ACQ78347.1 transcriptional regulator, TrmB [Beutenbergia cavernae DSM 12333]
MLEGIGLDEESARVYRALVERPSSTSAELAPDVGLAPSRVAEILGALETAGLAARQGADSERAVASPPGVALRALLAEQERRLDAVRSDLVDLEAVYREALAGRTVPDVVDLVLGADAVRQRFAQLQAAAGQQVRAFVRSDVPFVSAEENAEEERALLRGVRYRVLVERGVLDNPRFLAAAREALPYGEYVRVAPTLPTRLLIIDDDLALLPMRRPTDDRYGAILVHPSSLLDLLVEVFETTWSRAARLTDEGEPGAVDNLEELDGSLLTLLMVGLTDSRIASQLGVSTRTVQRRVSALMDLTRVATRFQLGAEAVRRGWV